MDISNNEINIKKMYDYQLEDIYSDDYQKYIKYLNTFFIPEHKKEKYIKSYHDGKYILTEKNNPKKIIKITPSEFKDIDKFYIELKENSELLLYKISLLIESKKNISENEKIEFENLKNKYIIYSEKIQDIENINKDFYKELDTLINEKIDKTIELAKFYQKRLDIYNTINVQINNSLKNKLIIIFKNNKKKIPSDTEINKIGKENNIPSIEIEKWFKWIEATYFYLLCKKIIFNINDKITEKEKHFEMNKKNMIIKKPILEE
jgi:hypothetical protein